MFNSYFDQQFVAISNRRVLFGIHSAVFLLSTSSTFDCCCALCQTEFCIVSMHYKWMHVKLSGGKREKKYPCVVRLQTRNFSYLVYHHHHHHHHHHHFSDVFINTLITTKIIIVTL